jgi:hypothetical protein
MSTDIATLTSAELAALKNPHVIAIDQSGAQAAKAVTSGHVEAVIKDGGRVPADVVAKYQASAGA